MKKLTFLVMVFVLTSCAFGQAEETYFGTVMMSAGGQLLPNAAVPTPLEVSAVGVSATQAKASSITALNSLALLFTATSNLTDSVSVLNGASIMYGACVSFGSQSVESNTNAASTIVAMNIVSNTVDKSYVDIYTYYDEAPASLPVVEFAESLPSANASGWVAIVSVSTVLTTHTWKGVEVECYRNTVEVPRLLTGAFFRVKAKGKQTVVGQFLKIYRGITVNGVQGISGEIEGWGTVHDGRLVTLVVETLDEGGATE